jgi:hypothetical protein
LTETRPPRRAGDPARHVGRLLSDRTAAANVTDAMIADADRTRLY